MHVFKNILLMSLWLFVGQKTDLASGCSSVFVTQKISWVGLVRFLNKKHFQKKKRVVGASVDLSVIYVVFSECRAWPRGEYTKAGLTNPFFDSLPKSF